ncbi:hypothetical protein [Bdellovibrio sp. HCB337]|uniref:hypothetical protein n=1 Tax=Bdellovibrio sp. HCB337 TaxID=3394358 RepID=UPI0039A529F6
MKSILLVTLLAISTNVYAESDLETDDSFFKSSAAPYEDDELDRMQKKNALIKSNENQKMTDTKVKDEFSTATPGVMQSFEARAMDERVIAENKRRQQAIIRQLKSSSAPIYQCVSKDPHSFEGTKATVIWMVGQNGKVLDSAIKDTDIVSNEIQKCIHDVAMSMNFDEAKTDLIKKSHVEYTYKFKKRIIKPARTAKAPVRTKKIQRRTASQ